MICAINSIDGKRGSESGLARSADNLWSNFSGRDGRQDPIGRHDYGRGKETALVSLHRSLAGADRRFGNRRHRRQRSRSLSAARMDQASGGRCVYCDWCIDSYGKVLESGHIGPVGPIRPIRFTTMPQTRHTERHFTAGETVRDIVIGMSDGLTVPFALAAGLTGIANASPGIIVTAGLAEVAAGAIAMGLGGYLAARSDAEHYAKEREREKRE